MYYQYGNNGFYDSSSNSFKHTIRKIIENLVDSYESKATKFYEELRITSSKFGLGKDISFGIVYDGPSPEKVFTINIPHKLDIKEKYYILDQIVNHMADFSRKENMFDFFKDAYILIK